MYADLKSRGIHAFEYSGYSLMSSRTHPNLMASQATAQETDLGGGLINTVWGVGGFNNPPVTARALFEVCLAEYHAVVDPLLKLYRPHFSKEELLTYREVYERCAAELAKLIPAPPPGEPAPTAGVDIAIRKIEKKFDSAKQKMLAEMRDILGPDFSVEDVDVG